METENLEENARKKLSSKKIDWIVANSLREKNAGFESDQNHVFVISEDEEFEFSGTKKELGYRILEKVIPATE
jgi:phosphopantothenoylcysteine decarboxylase/phosphopantothenate--cysteine ligase